MQKRERSMYGQSQSDEINNLSDKYRAIKIAIVGASLAGLAFFGIINPVLEEERVRKRD